MTEYVALSAFEQVALQIENAKLKDSLRHQYSAAALTGLLANPENMKRFKHDGYAKEALKIADAVIAELTQPEDSDVQPTPAIFAAT